VKIVVAGGTGFAGCPVVRRLAQDGHDLLVLSRTLPRSEASASIRFALWDAKTPGPWVACLEGAGAVVNLTGEPIAARRWTALQKQKILSSRVDSTRALVRAIGQLRAKPPLLINASGLGYYGDTGGVPVTESQGRGSGFLADVCGAWEQEALEARATGVRVVLLRLGMVLARDGGALRKMIPPFVFFAGGPLGSGRQWMSWIERSEMAGVIRFVIERAELEGPVNVCAPGAVTMAQFSAVLGKVMDRPSWLKVPESALRLLLGEMATVLLTGQRAVPEKLERAGYRFRHPELEPALRAMLCEGAS